MNLLRIGVVGYMQTGKHDERTVATMLNYAFDAAVRFYGPIAVEIVSGLSDVGVAAIAYRIARERGWQTAGIACEKVSEYEEFPVDSRLIVGKDWGDESEAFLNCIDVIIRVGGGRQARDEVERFRDQGGRSYIYEL